MPTSPDRPRALSIARGVALFIGGLSGLNLLARARAGGFDANDWWVDFYATPAGVSGAVVAALAVALCTWACRPACGPVRRRVTLGLIGVAGTFAIANLITFYRLRAAGVIGGPVFVPFSALVVAVFAWLAWNVWRSPSGHAPPLRPFAALAGVACCAIGFPLAQIACYGWTDYRRPADAILVFGARAFADGTPSDALADRTLTAIDLYRRGLAPRLIFSGGPGDGAPTEPDVMRAIALAHGVPDFAIVLDPRGLTTDATSRNVAPLIGPGRRVLAVSHGWHLPRVKLQLERAGLTAYTVPADERGQPLRGTAYLVAREVAAFWVYYVRAIAG